MLFFYFFLGMRGQIIVPCVIAVWLLCSCSKTDKPASTGETEETESEQASSPTFLPSPNGKSSTSDHFGETRTLAAPDTTPREPVSESPGIVDNREAQVALDLLKMPESEAKSLALTELFRRWAKDDLDAAMEFLPYLDKDIEAKRSFYRGVQWEILEKNPELLLDIIGEGNWWQDQWRAEGQAMAKVADTNLERLIDHYTNTVPGKQFPHIAGKIANSLMLADSFEEAEAFAMSIERPDSRGTAMQAILFRWTDKDPVAASTYVDRITDPDLKDYAIRGMINRTVGDSPEETLAWTMTMQEGEVRTNAVKFLASRWSNPEQVENLKQLASFRGLSSEERTILETALNN